jgi:spore photoproduct lyase
MKPFEIERIYLDERAEGDEVARAVLARLPGVPIETVRGKAGLIASYNDRADPLEAGKKALYLTPFYGRRLKPCPGTSHHICCGYFVINAVTGCPMDCAFCILQAYLNNPLLTLYTNWDALLSEIDELLSVHPDPSIRIGTGELGDSLALDPLFPVSKLLVPFFAERQKGILELKTKSAEVENLLDLDPRGRTVVSWSLNPPDLIALEEARTASLDERIEAARKVQEKGYLLGFHFDPLIEYPGWENGYRKTVEAVFRTIDPGRVAWVSLGCFRYPKELKAVSKDRFPGTRIFLGELFPGRDGKFRYRRITRIEMYKKMAGWLRDVDPNLFVYLCMESPEVWEAVFGWFPRNSGHLHTLFRDRLLHF